MRKVTEGSIPFMDYRTHYRIVGDLKAGRAPLVCLHGGPGSTRAYFELLDALADDGRAVISYDQLGCGEAYLEGHPELWCAQTWLSELENLIDSLGLGEYHLLGQSWGGMMAIQYAVERRPCRCRSIVISSGHPSSRLWSDEGWRMARELPEDEYEALVRASESGDYDDEGYRRAIAHYMQLHCADQVPSDDAPECLRRPSRKGAESYLVAWGPDELTPTGTLRDWEYRDRLGEVDLPTLIFSGTSDLCTPLVAKTMFDGIPHARWELMANCRHMCFADDNPRYLELVGAWLSEHD